jgi:AraC-like DNA-binding protein
VDRLSAALLSRAPVLADEAAFVDDAVDRIVADRSLTRVESLAAELAVSTRTLQRRFDALLGAGPKWVIQRRRMHDALAEITSGRAVDWTDLALRLGFADQAHFVNAFTAQVGRPPRAYEQFAGRDPAG